MNHREEGCMMFGNPIWAWSCPKCTMFTLRWECRCKDPQAGEEMDDSLICSNCDYRKDGKPVAS